MLRFAIISAAALAASACTQSDIADTPVDPAEAAPGGTVTDMGETTSMPQMQASLNTPDAASLHALLLAHEDALVPSDWNTGAPAGAQYWDFPATLDGLEASSECDWEGNDQSAMDCTLTLVETGAEDGGPRRALYRAEVGYTPEGDLILLSPNVRWAVIE